MQMTTTNSRADSRLKAIFPHNLSTPHDRLPLFVSPSSVCLPMSLSLHVCAPSSTLLSLLLVSVYLTLSLSSSAPLSPPPPPSCEVSE